IQLGAALDGQTLAVAELPKRYGVTAVLLKYPDGKKVKVEEPRPGTVLAKGSEILLVGRREKVQRFERDCGEQR
ncbi:MAG: TrkA C-terminal domain-containing protein, partial [Opitutaceae bacterium]